MTSLGGYPMGAQYDPRAPWNETDRGYEGRYTTCTCCNGKGVLYEAWDVEEETEYDVTEEEYKALPPKGTAGAKETQYRTYSCRWCCGGKIYL